MKIRLSSIDKGLFYFAIIDILFLPYMYIITTLYSLIFVFLWFLFSYKRIPRTLELKAFYVFVFFAVVSTIISVLFIPANDFKYAYAENIKRCLQFILGLLYYFFFQYVLKNYPSIKISKIFFVYFVYVATWASLYYFNIDLFFTLKRIFNPNDSFLAINTDGYIYRFSFIWSDPNNFGYALVGMLYMYLIFMKKTYIEAGIATIVTLFSLVLVMSTGTWMSFFIILPFLCYYTIKDATISISQIVIAFITFSMLLIFVFYSIEDFLSSEIAINSFERVESNSGDSRFHIWRMALETHNIFAYIILGTGYVFYINNKFFSVHSGHLLLIYSYGLISYICYVYILFCQKISLKKYITLTPFLFCFTVNIGITEQKFAGILYLVIALLIIKGNKKNESTLYL